MDTRPWWAFRIDCDSSRAAAVFDAVECCLQQPHIASRIARWFYLWHGDGGFHLRLRLQPRLPCEAGALSDSLAQMADASLAELRFTAQVYDRNLLAFGETLESVLAELLHVATAAVSRGVLARSQEQYDSVPRAVLAGGIAGYLINRAFGPTEGSAVIHAWHGFTLTTCQRMGIPLAHPTGRQIRTWHAVLDTTMQTAERALADRAVSRQVIWLLRRLWRREGLARFVAVHGLHFFCNQMGVSIRSEESLVGQLNDWPVQGEGAVRATLDRRSRTVEGRP